MSDVNGSISFSLFIKESGRYFSLPLRLNDNIQHAYGLESEDINIPWISVHPLALANDYYVEYEQVPEIHSLSQFVFEFWSKMKEDGRVKRERENGEFTVVSRLYLSMSIRIHQIRMRAGGRADYSYKIISLNIQLYFTQN